MEYINADGKWLKADTPIITADNRGLRFGDGLFETIKYSKGKLQLADAHFERLWKGLQVLQFDIPKHFTPALLQKQIEALLNKNRHLPNARIRLTVFRGNGGLYDAVYHKPHYLIQSWPLPQDQGKWNTNGLVLGLYTDVKKSCDILSNLKHNNFLPYALAALHAKKAQWNDAILLNTHGGICDTTIANIFLIKDGIFSTPALHEGCIAGITRANLIHKLKDAGYRVIEEAINTDTLLKADEVFLTNAIYNMRWVQSIAGKSYHNQLSQKIFNRFFQQIPDGIV